VVDLTKLAEVFFVKKTEGLSKDRFASYRKVFWIIIILHIFLFIACIAVTIYLSRPDATVGEKLNSFFTLMQCISILSGLLVVCLSLKSEMLISQTYEFALASSQAKTHQFDSFEEHITWLRNNLSPVQFPELELLSMAVSTPLYGIGVNDGNQQQDEFLDFLQSWVTHFKTTSPKELSRPTVELTVWSKEDNISTFGAMNLKWNSPPLSDSRTRFCNLLNDMYQLHVDRKINLRFYYSDQSHVRVFLAKSQNSHKFTGLMAMFTPLTKSAIEKRKWRLLGFSFWDADAFENILQFVRILQIRNHTRSIPQDLVTSLSRPEEWFAKHYGLKGSVDNGV
jgi:hypothetical protein